MTIYTTRPVAGWNETASLPELGVDSIRVKLDTGAKTSALHAFNVSEIQKDDQAWVEFEIHPLQNNDTYVVKCSSPISDIRHVKSSNGQKEKRYVIFTILKVGSDEWPIEITLTNRDQMSFRMLLGRSAMKNHLLVDPQKTYLLSDAVRQKRERK